MFGVTSAILVASDKPHWTALLSVPMPIIALTGHWLLIPKFGAMGASATTLLVANLGALAGIIAVDKQWHVLPPKMTLCRSFVVSLIILFVAQFWTVIGIGLLVKLPVLGIAIVLMLLLLGEISQRDRRLIRSIFGKRLITK
jgi:O-antigen/teichoic acid export membrane protein